MVVFRDNCIRGGWRWVAALVASVWATVAGCSDAEQHAETSDACVGCVDATLSDGSGETCPCGLGEVCGVATSAEALCVPGCTSASPCAAGYQCVDEVCEAGCSDDTHCAAGEACHNAACLLQCSLSAQCAMGRACVDGLCLDVECLSDADCGRGERCANRTCEVLVNAACVQDEECGRNGVCAEARCVECASDEDCRAGRICSDANRCEQGTAPGVRFVPIAAGIEEHEIGYDEEDSTGYGPGYALVDVDRDGRLDIAAARTPQADRAGLCVYRNVSENRRPRFEVAAELCNLGVEAMAVASVDFDGDGWEELVAMGVETLVWLDPTAPGTRRDLLAELPPTDPRAVCSAGSSLSLDFDGDGYLDLLVGCQIPPDANFPEDIPIEELTWTRNLLLLGSPSGPVWADRDATAQALLDDPGITLAFGALVGSDGRWSIVHANDSFSFPGRRNTEFSPGSFVRPEANEVWSLQGFFPRFVREPLIADDRAWGSFMGVSSLRVGSEHYLLVSDAGPVHALRTSDDSRTDVARELGLAVPEQDGFLLFSWALLVDDYDADGLEDVLIVHGMVPDRDIDAHLSHRDVLALQNADATFDVYYEGFGVTLPSQRDSSLTGLAPQGRAAMKLDADGDGRLDLLLTYNLGSPEYYELDEEPRRCTVLPRPAVVMSRNAGFAFDIGDHVWRTWDVGGQHRASPSRDLLMPGRSGRLRFPSGYVTDFDCGADARVEVVEPDWMYRVDGPGTVVHIERPVFDGVEISTIDGRWRANGESGETRLAKRAGTDDWIALDAPDGAEVMVRINGRWIWRWW